MESKMGRVGDLGVKIAQMKNDFENTIENKGESNHLKLIVRLW